MNLESLDNFKSLKATSVVSRSIKDKSEMQSKVQVQEGASMIQVRVWVSASQKSSPG